MLSGGQTSRRSRHREVCDSPWTAAFFKIWVRKLWAAFLSQRGGNWYSPNPQEDGCGLGFDLPGPGLSLVWALPLGQMPQPPGWLRCPFSRSSPPTHPQLWFGWLLFTSGFIYSSWTSSLLSWVITRISPGMKFTFFVSLPHKFSPFFLFSLLCLSTCSPPSVMGWQKWRILRRYCALQYDCQTLKTRDTKEMGNSPGISSWGKEKASARGKTCLPGRDSVHSNILSEPSRMRVKPRQGWVNDGQDLARGRLTCANP